MVQLVLCICISSALPEVLWAREPTGKNETDINPVIQFYQTHISGIDGNRCPMYPSCSRYSAQAIRKHGLGLGWIMACDRVLRCGRDEVRLSPHIRVNGRQLTFDPVSANDFWWFSSKPPASPPPLLNYNSVGWVERSETQQLIDVEFRSSTQPAGNSYGPKYD